MTIAIFAVVGALVGGAVLDGFGSGVWTGAALGALLAWVNQLRDRLRVLEHRADRVEPVAIPVAPSETPTVSHEPEPTQTGSEFRAADTRTEPDVPDRSGPGDPFEQRAAPAKPSEPPPSDEAPMLKPSAYQRLIDALKRWFTTGNIPVKVGVILSVIGVGFLVKEAMDRSWLILPLELRLAAVAVFGIALLVIGWRLRNTRPAYALSVQGGGIAVLYITTYASFALYGLLPSVLAFLLLIVVTAATGLLAVLQNSRALAVFGIVGGFMAPVLTSSSSGNHVLLFSYYAILNGAVFGVAWFKAWRELNVLGFLFTFVIGSLWGYTAYRPSQFASTEPFLILFVLMYTIIPVLFASRHKPELKGFVDGTLVFGTPIVGFGLQTQLIGDSEYGLAISAVALAAVYIVLARYLLRRAGDELRVLTESFLALGLVFLTIAVPLALDARWTSVAWSLQGAAMVWLGLRQHRRLALVAGVVLQLAAAAAYSLQSSFVGDSIAVLNGYYLGALLIALAGWFSSWVFDRMRASLDSDLGFPRLLLASTWLSLAWGTAWWFGAGIYEIDRFVASRFELNAYLVFLAVTVFAVMPAATRFSWPRFNTIGLLLVPATVLGIAAASLNQPHPFARFGWLAWPLVLAAYFSFLRLREQQFQFLVSTLHVVGYGLIAALLATEIFWLVDLSSGGIWPGAATLAAVALWVLATLNMRSKIAWPLATHWQIYVKMCSGSVIAVLGAATVLTNLLSAGTANPLPYVPLLNPLEIASVLVFLVLLRWYSTARQYLGVDALEPRYRALIPALLGLFLITMAVARSVHHWAGVPFDLERLADSNVLQAALSIVWGLTGLTGMIVGARGKRREIWLSGALLMAVVVVKLFLVELGDSGTVTRVVSFLGVGVLLLIVGYVAPVPPRAEQQVATN